MRTIAFMTFVLAAFLSGHDCTAGEAASKPVACKKLKNLHLYPVKHPKCKAFAAIAQPTPRAWPFGYVTNEGELFLLEPRPPLGLTIMQVDQSPGGGKVFIVSEGEGLVELHVFRLQDLLISDTSESDNPVSINSIDMWPGSPANIRWIDDETIQFESEVDYTVFDRKARKGRAPGDFEKAKTRTWRYNLTQDTFSEVLTR